MRERIVPGTSFYVVCLKKFNYLAALLPSYAYCSSVGLKGYALTLGEARAACERTATGTLEWLPAPDETAALGTVARDAETGVLYLTLPLPH